MKEPGNFFNHPVYLCTSDITHFLHSAHASAASPSSIYSWSIKALFVLYKKYIMQLFSADATIQM